MFPRRSHRFKGFRYSDTHSVAYRYVSMPGVTSATGLIAARVRPIYTVRKKRVELCGHAKPAPFVLRPFAGFFNPYPYGCSVLCNHPADYEAKEVVRRARESWANEGKALLLPVEMEMIRAGLTPVQTAESAGADSIEGVNDSCHLTEAMSVPEELFRRYTDMDSRPLTPTSTPGPTQIPRSVRDLTEKTTLVLDLRTKENKDQESELLSWRGITLEPPPPINKTKMNVPKPVVKSAPSTKVPPPSPANVLPPIEIHTAVVQSTDDYDDTTSDEIHANRKHKKKKKKRKHRRGSTYGQQTEVRDPPEPSETLVSQNKGDSRRSSLKIQTNDQPTSNTFPEKTLDPVIDSALSSSFISSDVLKHLCRDLDREMIEWEFSLKRKMALEEALRVKKEMHAIIRGRRQLNTEKIPHNVPRVFTRQSARFELLDSQSLNNLTPLQYLSKHVYVTDSRKFVLSKIFNQFNEDSYEGTRYMLPKYLFEALKELLSKPLTEDQKSYLTTILGDITDSLDFRSWCGICAFVERAIPSLSNREIDPPDWIEWADFKTLDERFKNCTELDPRLADMLRLIRDR